MFATYPIISSSVVWREKWHVVQWIPCPCARREALTSLYKAHEHTVISNLSGLYCSKQGKNSPVKTHFPRALIKLRRGRKGRKRRKRNVFTKIVCLPPHRYRLPVFLGLHKEWARSLLRALAREKYRVRWKEKEREERSELAESWLRCPGKAARSLFLPSAILYLWTSLLLLWNSLYLPVKCILGEKKYPLQDCYVLFNLQWSWIWDAEEMTLGERLEKLRRGIK